MTIFYTPRKLIKNMHLNLIPKRKMKLLSCTFIFELLRDRILRSGIFHFVQLLSAYVYSERDGVSPQVQSSKLHSAHRTGHCNQPF